MAKERPQSKILKHMRVKRQPEWSGIHIGNIHLLENFSLQRRRQKIHRNQVTQETSLYKYLSALCCAPFQAFQTKRFLFIIPK